LPFSRLEATVKITAILRRTDALEAPLAPWALLAGELAAGFLLLLSDRLPPVLLQSLQLFLRF
jgi:hypothetical protein